LKDAMPLPVLTAAFASPADFLIAFDAEIGKGGLLVRGASVGNAPAMSECRVSVAIAGEAAVEVTARIAAVVPGVGIAVIFEGVPAPLAELAARLRAPAAPAEEEEPEQKGPLTERLKAMSVQQKFQLALSGSRDERLALFRDHNKPVHVFVLKNPRIGIDEVQYAAKLPNLAPDAIKMISEHREWGMNSTICTALVRNPKTPMPIALKLLDRVPPSEVRSIAKGGARDQIVHAARKKVNP
jgi:hypothetical protein